MIENNTIKNIERKSELDKSDRIWLGVTGVAAGLGSYIPFIFISWYLSDKVAELLNIDYGINPPEEVLVYVFCVIPVIILSSLLGVKFSKLFFGLAFTSLSFRYLCAFIGAILGGLLVSFLFSLFVVAFAYTN